MFNNLVKKATFTNLLIQNSFAKSLFWSRIRISPYGSGSSQPPTIRIQRIRIHITGDSVCTLIQYIPLSYSVCIVYSSLLTVYVQYILHF